MGICIVKQIKNTESSKTASIRKIKPKDSLITKHIKNKLRFKNLLPPNQDSKVDFNDKSESEIEKVPSQASNVN